MLMGHISNSIAGFYHSWLCSWVCSWLSHWILLKSFFPQLNTLKVLYWNVSKAFIVQFVRKKGSRHWFFLSCALTVFNSSFLVWRNYVRTLSCIKRQSWRFFKNFIWSSTLIISVSDRNNFIKEVIWRTKESLININHGFLKNSTFTSTG